MQNKKHSSYEMGFMPTIVGDAKTCPCKDCKYRLKYEGELKDADYIKRYNDNATIKCVCKKFNEKSPKGMQIKPYGIVENNEACDLYVKE